MKKVLFTVAMVALCAVVATSASAASRGAEFTGLGFADDPGPFPASAAYDMSGDGEVIVGCDGEFGCGLFYWTEDGGHPIIDGTNSVPSISNFYDVLATPSSIGAPAIWVSGFFPNAIWGPTIAEATGFAPCGSSGQSAFNISKDGNWTTGLTWIDENGDGSGCEGANAFLNDQSTNTTVALSDALFGGSRGNAVNGDGTVVVGFMQTTSREAAKWVNGVQGFICPDPTGLGGINFCSEGQDVTADGSLMLTRVSVPSQGDFAPHAALVDQAGNMEVLPDPPGVIPGPEDSTRGWAVNSTGDVVVGEFGGGNFGAPPYPVAWYRDLDATIDLQIMLLGQGLDDLFFWFLQAAFAVSDDGTVIAGRGFNPNNQLEAFKIDIGKVKVCHKPEGEGQGNDRTIAIAWDSVGDHLNHGDSLSTCEFAKAGGRSRAIEKLRRNVPASTSVTHDDRLLTASQIDDLRNKIAGVQVEAGNPGSVEVNSDNVLTPEEREIRIRQLEERIRRGPVRRGR